MLDFVTITFNNECELNLLRLQAYSFKYVDINIINNIYIIFNEDVRYFHLFKTIFKNIITYYPSEIQYKIKLLSLEDLNIQTETQTSWFSQQRVKLEVSKYIKNKYYVVLDSKNHFISNINKDFFFKNDKVRLYFNMIGEEMLQYYNNCFEYFDVSCPNKKLTNKNKKIQTTTPFLFITEECLRLIDYIEKKEQISFGTFFMREKKYTEFYLYYAFLTYSKKRYLCCFLERIQHPCITIGGQNPNIDSYNSWEHKMKTFESKYIAVFSIHRKSIQIIDNTYKQKMLKFYNSIFNDIKIQNLLETILFTKK
jgi:hypothetical protein